MTFILLITAALVSALAAGELFSVRFRRLAWRRRRETFRTLESSYHDGAVEPRVLAATQSYFDQITGVRGFPVRPEDRLLEVYGLASEDVSDALAIIASTLECTPLAPDDAGSAEATVEGLVHATQRAYLAARAATAARARAAKRA